MEHTMAMQRFHPGDRVRARLWFRREQGVTELLPTDEFTIISVRRAYGGYLYKLNVWPWQAPQSALMLVRGAVEDKGCGCADPTVFGHGCPSS